MSEETPHVYDLTEELNREIEKMATEAGLTKEELYRRALRRLRQQNKKEPEEKSP